MALTDLSSFKGSPAHSELERLIKERLADVLSQFLAGAGVLEHLQAKAHSYWELLNELSLDGLKQDVSARESVESIKARYDQMTKTRMAEIDKLMRNRDMSGSQPL